MVKTCCAPNCRNKSKKPGISFFCFPKSLLLRQEWIRRVNKANFQPTRHTVLCSDHFPSDSFLSESVPEFLQLIGLEQRPSRRRLKSGALPTLFKLTSSGWEEGYGEVEGVAAGERREGGEEDAAREEDGLTEESDDDGHFVIQMDVAEEDTETEASPEGPQTAIPQTDQPRNESSAESGSSIETNANSCKDHHETSAQEDSGRPQEDNGRPSRPRRSCRNRGAEAEQSRKERREHEDGGGESPEKTLQKEAETKSDGSNKEGRIEEEEDGDDERCQEESDHEYNGDGPGDEPRLFTIESVRTLQDNDRMTDSGEEDNSDKKDPEGSDLYCLDTTDCNPPPVKKSKSNRKSPAGEATVHLLPSCQAHNPRPILCRIDPAFCKFQTVFEVPFTSSPILFNRTVDTVVSVSSSKAGKAVCCNGGSDTPRQSSLPLQTVTATGGDVTKSSSGSAVMPSSDGPSPTRSPTCTLPCCTSKLTTGTSFAKVVHIKQEAADTDYPELASDRPAEQRLPESKRTTRLSPGEIPYRSSPIKMVCSGNAKGDLPYRSEPINFTRVNDSKGGGVPYRSEPLIKRPLPLMTPTQPSQDQPAEKAKRNLTKELGLSRPGHHSPHDQAYCSGSMLPAGKGDGAKSAGGQSGSKRRTSAIKSPTTPTTSSMPAVPKKKISAVADALSSGHLSSLLTSPSVPLISQASDPASSLAAGISEGPIFIRRDHVLADLLDVFKNSGDRIQRSTIFRLCHNVSGSTSTSSSSSSANTVITAEASTRLEPLQENWEDVQYKRLFSLFWEECLKTYFDGYQQKVPKLDTQKSASSPFCDIPYVLGKVLRHGFVLCGYWPVALSSACAVSVFTGEKCSQGLFLRSLRRALFPYEMQALDDLREGAKEGGVRFQEVRKERRIGVVVETYGGSQCQVPAVPEEVEAFLVELAAYYLYCQPFWWLREMRRGFLCMTEHTRQDQNYLTSMTEREVVEMYNTLDPTPQALLRRITFRTDDSRQGSHSRLKAYLERCLLRMAPEDLVRLLKKWSHADCLLDESYHVKFTSASVSPSHGAPPFVRPSINTLVLTASNLSFERFEATLRTLLQEQASVH